MKRYTFENSIIVSCQAGEDEPLHGPDMMKRMAIAAKMGGAKGIRANSPQDIKAIKEAVDLPVIGIFKERRKKDEAFITIRKESIKKIVEAGADLIAIDCTRRKRPEPLEKLFSYTRRHYPNIPIIADIADLEDVKNILRLKPNFISTTLSGYTEYTKNRPKPDIPLIEEIRKMTDIPVLAEGNYTHPRQVREAILRGAYAVVIGGAITRPQLITERFSNAVSDLPKGDFNAIGLDIGGTWIRGVKIGRYGDVLMKHKEQNPGDPNSIIKRMIKIIEKMKDDRTIHIGIASAGRIDVGTGKVIYATANIPGWMGVEIGKSVEEKFGIFPHVDNDANCAAYAQWWNTKENSLVFITVGTGIGGGIIVDGKIQNGIFGMGGEIGHIIYPTNEKNCSCGKIGCIETLISGRSLKEIMDSEGNNIDEILRDVSKKFAWLIDVIMHVIAPAKIYIGGIAPKYGEKFLWMIREEVEKLSNFEYPSNIVEFSNMGEFAGAIGAALSSLNVIPK